MLSSTGRFTVHRDGSIVVLTPRGPTADLDEAKAILDQLRRLIAIGEVDRVALDLSRIEFPEDAFLAWMFQLYRHLSRRWGHGRLVACNAGPGMHDLLSAAGLDQLFVVIDGLEDAIAQLRAIGPTDPFDPDRWTKGEPRELGPLCLIGCPERDFAQVPGQMRAFGLDLVDADVVSDGDHVLFCVSCADGPTEGTRRSVDRCASRVIVPVAIVLTHAELVDDDSLRDLVTYEEMELLTRIMPSQEIDRLLLLYDFDPNLASKVRSKMVNGSTPIRCRGG